LKKLIVQLYRFGKTTNVVFSKFQRSRRYKDSERYLSRIDAINARFAEVRAIRELKQFKTKLDLLLAKCTVSSIFVVNVGVGAGNFLGVQG